MTQHDGLSVPLTIWGTNHHERIDGKGCHDHLGRDALSAGSRTEKKPKYVFLEVCMGIEILCAELYHYYSRIYEDIPEASRLWEKTALEEENHLKQFELALRLISESEFEVITDGLDRAHSIHYKLLKFIELCKRCKPDLKTAVSTAIIMEEKLADLHANSSLNFKDESMQKLFKSLSEADHGHVSELQQYRSILYLPQSEMRG